MRVLVTGSGGFIGQHLMRVLSHTPEVTGLLGIDLLPANGKLELEKDIFEIGDVCQHQDAIVHLAALPGVAYGEAHPTECLSTNVAGTSAVIQAAIKHNIRKIVFASSSTVYGRRHGCDEEMWEGEDLDPSQMGVYGSSKWHGELLLRNWEKLDDRNELVILRLFSVMGTGLRDDLAPSIFLRKIQNEEPITLYGGEQTRDITHVMDVCRAFQLALQYGRCSFMNTFNIGSGNPVRIKDMLDYMTNGLDLTDVVIAPAREFESQHTRACNEYARKFLKWTPALRWEDAISQFMEGAKNGSTEHHSNSGNP